MRYTPIFLLLGAAVLNCAQLTAYPENTCGNHVVDRGEDCDLKDDRCVSCRLRCDVKGDAGDTLGCPGEKDGLGLGWACGVDGICRQASGSLEEAGPIISSSVYALKAGDFDADKRDDILGSPKFGSAGASKVHYFDSKGALSSITPIDLSIAVPIVADLDHQGGLDIGFAARNLTQGGFGALAGQPDRTFSTIVFPNQTVEGTDTRLVVINANPTLGYRLPGGMPGCAVGVRTLGAGTVFDAVCVEGPDPGPPLTNFGGVVPDDLKVGSIIGLPKLGRFLEPTDPSYSACGELVFVTAKTLYIVPPCTSGLGAPVLWRDNPQPLAISLNGTLVKDDDKIFVGPVTRSDADDLVVHVDRGFLRMNRVSHVLEDDGRFSILTGLPLASGDLDGDGIPDFVLRSGIKLSTPNPLAVGADAGPYKPDPSVFAWSHQVAVRDQLRWSQARIGRFNNDDLPDVLVSFEDAYDVDVMRNLGNGTFTSFTVRSEQKVRQLASGDFDGDRIEDVAFLQSANLLGTADESTLGIAFGSAEGGPSATITSGKFKYAGGVTSIRSRTGTDSLGVVQTLPVAGQNAPNTAISVLFGSGGRVPVAPLFFKEGSDTDRRWEPVSFTVGKFPNQDTSAIIGISTGFTITDDRTGPPRPSDFHTRPWLALPDPSSVGGFGAFTMVGQDLTELAGLDQAAFIEGKRQLRLITAAGDIDVEPDGTDELVNMAPAPNQTNVVSVVTVHTASAPPVVTTIANIQNASVDEGDPIEVVDIDGDGFKDIVYIITVRGKRALNVMRGDGKGGFEVDKPISTEGTAVEGAVAFSMLDTGFVNGKRVKKAAVVTKEALWLVEINKSGQPISTNVTRALGTPQDITGITSGDFNGDGVPDLAVAQQGGIRVILQKAKNEQ